MNPPMVHALAAPPPSDSPAHMVASACGDGSIALWDFDKVRQTTTSQPDHLISIFSRAHRSCHNPHRGETGSITCVSFFSAPNAALMAWKAGCSLHAAYMPLVAGGLLSE